MLSSVAASAGCGLAILAVVTSGGTSQCNSGQGCHLVRMLLASLVQPVNQPLGSVQQLGEEIPAMIQQYQYLQRGP